MKSLKINSNSWFMLIINKIFILLLLSCQYSVEKKL